VLLGFHFSNSGGDGCAKSPSCEKHRAESSVLSLASLLKNSLLALTRLFKCLKVFFERLAEPLKQSPVFFPFLSRELAVRSVEVRKKFLLRKSHSIFRPPQVFQRFWGWHVALFGHYVCVTHSHHFRYVARLRTGQRRCGRAIEQVAKLCYRVGWRVGIARFTTV
jgi:hypothetical protein